MTVESLKIFQISTLNVVDLIKFYLMSRIPQTFHNYRKKNANQVRKIKYWLCRNTTRPKQNVLCAIFSSYAQKWLVLVYIIADRNNNKNSNSYSYNINNNNNIMRFEWRSRVWLVPRCTFTIESINICLRKSISRVYILRVPTVILYMYIII